MKQAFQFVEMFERLARTEGIDVEIFKRDMDRITGFGFGLERSKKRQVVKSSRQAASGVTSRFEL